jgi:molecular chaperone GrpE (heat shock protein)
MSDGKSTVLSLEEIRAQEEQRKKMREEQLVLAEEERKRAEKQRKEREKKQRLAAKKEADYKKLLGEKLPKLNRQLSGLNNQLSASNEKIAGIKKNLSTQELNIISQELENLAQSNANVQADIERARVATSATKKEAMDLSGFVKGLTRSSGKVKKDYEALERKLMATDGKLQQLGGELKVASADLFGELATVESSFANIAELSGGAALEMAITSNQLDEENDLVNQKLAHLYSKDSLQSLVAFMEITSLEKCGYILKGVQTDEELNLWFEEIDGKNKIAIAVKPTKEVNEGVKWLKQMRVFSSEAEDDQSICHTQAAYLAEMGVEYEFTAWKAPKSPPPGNIEEWRRSVGRKADKGSGNKPKRSENYRGRQDNSDKA